MQIRAWLFLLAVIPCIDAMAAPDIQHWPLDNGARAYFIETHQLPMIQVAVGFDAGSARDSKPLKGLARFVRKMMEEGVPGMDGIAIAEQFDSTGAVFWSDNGRDMSLFKLRSLSDPPLLEAAVDLFAKVIQRPTFPLEAVERVRDNMLVRLKLKQQSPDDVVALTFYDLLFKDHPYGNTPAGQEDGVVRIRRKDMVDFHNRYFVGTNAVVAIVGDLDISQARSLADRIVGALPSGTAPQELADVPQVDGTHEVAIDFPSSQTHLMMGQVGIARSDRDYFPLYVGNYILGGDGLISRLADEIREKRGLAYSVYSDFEPMKQSGSFVVNLQTRNDQSDIARDVTIATIADFVREGPTAAELEMAKKNITGGFPLRIASNRKIANYLLTIAFYDLPLDYLETFPRDINAVTLEQVKDAFRRRVFPQPVLRVAVGGE